MAKELNFEEDFTSIFIYNKHPDANESKVIYVKHRKELVNHHIQISKYSNPGDYFVGMIPKTKNVMYSTKFGAGTSYNQIQIAVINVKNNSQITGRLGLLTTLYIYNILILLLLNRK